MLTFRKRLLYAMLVLVPRGTLLRYAVRLILPPATNVKTRSVTYEVLAAMVVVAVADPTLNVNVAFVMKILMRSPAAVLPIYST